MKRTLLRRVVAPMLLAPLAVVAPARSTDVVLSETLDGTVYLPGGVIPAPAAIVDLMLAGPTGQPIAGSAFARSVADLDGHFSVDPRERDGIVAAVRAAGGDLPVAVQVGKLARHGSIDPAALPGSDAPDVAYALGTTTLHLVETTDAQGNSLPLFTFYLHRPDVDDLARIVLDLAEPVRQRAAVLGMVNDPDLVAGWDNPDDPDVIPPLGSTLLSMVPSIDASTSASPNTVPHVVPPLPKPHGGDDNNAASCKRNPSTYWWDGPHGRNNPPHTVTMVYLDTYACAGDDADDEWDEEIYDWTGYSGTNDHDWRLYRLKYRSQVDEDAADYFTILKPDPATGDYTTGDTGSLSWTVGWDYVVVASISGSYSFSKKKIHAWQADGTGRLYHVSWISDDEDGSYGLGRNNGGGFKVRVPEGMYARNGVVNTLHLWMCEVVYRKGSYEATGCDK